MNKFDEVRAAVAQARSWQRAVDDQANTMAGLLAGRLRSGKVSHSTLKALKKELRDYNIHTGRWKEK